MKPLRQTGLVWLWVALLVFMIDISTKFYIMNHMTYGWDGRIEVMPFFNLLYVHNLGAAFSFLSDKGGWQRWLFSGLAVVISIALIYASSRLSYLQRRLSLAYALIVGGAMGNVFDRIYHGFVIDFLDFYYKNHHWPTFNIADSAIILGAILIFIDSLFDTEQKDELKKEG